MMRMCAAGWFLMLLVLGAGSTPAADGDGDGARAEAHPHIAWLSYHEARAVGPVENKPIFLHFSADWSQWDKAMRRETYLDREVILQLKEHFVCGWVDVETQRGLARRYGVESYPTLWFLDSSGRSLTSVDGYLRPEKLLLVLEFIRTEAYKKTSYEAWKEKRLGR